MLNNTHNNAFISQNKEDLLNPSYAPYYYTLSRINTLYDVLSSMHPDYNNDNVYRKFTPPELKFCYFVNTNGDKLIPLFDINQSVLSANKIQSPFRNSFVKIYAFFFDFGVENARIWCWG
jgi:hypothetical protein